MKNITLSADEALIEAARQRAASENTTLNEQFRRWLERYVHRERQAERALGCYRLPGGSDRHRRTEVHARRNE